MSLTIPVRKPTWRRHTHVAVAFAFLTCLVLLFSGVSGCQKRGDDSNAKSERSEEEAEGTGDVGNSGGLSAGAAASGEEQGAEPEPVESASSEPDKNAGSTASEDPSAEERGGCLAEAKEQVETAKKLILANPSKAANLFAVALRCKNDPDWRGDYGFALERSGKVCAAYSEYKTALPELNGAAKKRAERGIEKYASKCE